MLDTKNSMTDALQLVQTQVINRIFSQAIPPENGFSLELFRSGVYAGSIRSNQMMKVN